MGLKIYRVMELDVEFGGRNLGQKSVALWAAFGAISAVVFTILTVSAKILKCLLWLYFPTSVIY